MDELLAYYNRELTYIRRMAREFAEVNPRVASQLKLTGDTVEDPHVGRLIESFAYIAARTRLKIEDEFPELSQALLNALYPSYLAPIPSMTTVRFQAEPGLGGPATVPAGTLLDTERVADIACRYRTAYPVTVLPLTVTAARLGGRPLTAPVCAASATAVAALRLTLECRGDVTFPALAGKPLRFFLAGQAHETFPLFELIHNATLAVALAAGPADPEPLILGPEAIRLVGFSPADGILPADGRSFFGYRLLAEYFAFPEKFMFFELDLPQRLAGKVAAKSLDLFLYLSASSRELERSVAPGNFLLGCTPAVNLFAQRAEPIRLTHEALEYRVVPDARRQAGLEVYEVQSVVASFQSGEEQAYRPIFGLSHDGATDAPFWHASRRQAGHRLTSSETFLTLVDGDLRPRAVRDAVLSIETWCLNRDLPAALPFGGGRPAIDCVEPIPGVMARAACVTAPTATLRPTLGPGHLWRLVSHLQLNHLSISAGEDATEALREILRLYDFRNSPDTRATIDSLLSVRAGLCSARLGGGLRSQFGRGTEVTIEFDERNWSNSGLFLFATVLEQFLALYCNINSFVRMTARLRGRTMAVKTWPARSGTRRLL